MEKPSVGFCQSNQKIGPLGFEAWWVAREFGVRISATYTSFLGLAALRWAESLDAVFGA